MEYAIGIDLGGTHLRVALVDRDGTILAHQRTRTGAKEGPEAVIDRIISLIQAVRQEAPDVLVRGVGVAAPGPLNPISGKVIMMPNLPGWEDFPLRDRIAAQVDWPVAIGNDANLAAVGEWLFGGGRGLQNLVYITISTGIGGGIISDGHLLLGHDGLAAEVGHVVLQHDGPDPKTGSPRGSWEALASGTALARQAAEALRAGTPTSLSAIATPDTVTTHQIEEAAAQGDAFAAGLIEQTGRWCGIAFVNLLHLFSPQAIFVGGGVSNLGDRLLGPAREEMARRALPGYRETPIIRTTLGDNIGVLGAAAYAFSELESK